MSRFIPLLARESRAVPTGKSTLTSSGKSTRFDPGPVPQTSDPRRAAFTPRTKVVIINTPHNPVGKVFTRHELEQFAKICIEKNVMVLADEVVSGC
jgi:aspartate/methionine/tyrosine aminotransferase